MKNILLLHCHPFPHKSRYNRALLAAARSLSFVTIHDLYEMYPDMHVDERKEQSALRGTDVLVIQFPLYWFSVPALLKEWQDCVLQNGFAYGAKGTALRGKQCLIAVSTGADETAYAEGSSHGATMDHYLAPLMMTMRFCGMEVLPPFIAYNARHCAYEQTKMRAHEFCGLLSRLAGVEEG